MNKKTSGIVFGAVVLIAILLGLLLVNKGDGPVTGIILSDTEIESAKEYGEEAKSEEEGVYLVVSNAFNKFQEDYSAEIPAGSDLYAAVHFVECPQGSEFSAKWIKDGETVSEESKELMTGPEGVISYMLEGSRVGSGTYTFELYSDSKIIFEKDFTVN